MPLGLLYGRNSMDSFWILNINRNHNIVSTNCLQIREIYLQSEVTHLILNLYFQKHDIAKTTNRHLYVQP